ncbi:MAG: HDOD domain-containing protein [Spirochaetaceae bacterium]|jgi:HD-like signal output (HDOD) protein|nr:HDOD domain-containing protein [Spirochaetaceae bacterium]
MSIDRAIEQQIINFTRVMPALPQTANGIMNICNSRFVDARHLYKLICVDPLLFCQTQALFTIYYPKLNTIYNSIAKIMIMLNVNTVKNHIMPFAEKTKDALAAKSINKKTLEYQSCFWRHAVATGITARFIAKERGIDPAQFELYYAAGLVHDLGKYFQVEGTSHSELGGLVAKTAGLYEGLLDVILHHHDVAKSKGTNADLVCTAALADYFVNSSLSAQQKTGSKATLGKEVWQRLSVSPEFLEKHKQMLVSEIKKCDAYIKVEN